MHCHEETGGNLGVLLATPPGWPEPRPIAAELPALPRSVQAVPGTCPSAPRGAPKVQGTSPRPRHLHGRGRSSRQSKAVTKEQRFGSACLEVCERFGCVVGNSGGKRSGWSERGWGLYWGGIAAAAKLQG